MYRDHGETGNGIASKGRVHKGTVVVPTDFLARPDMFSSRRRPTRLTYINIYRGRVRKRERESLGTLVRLAGEPRCIPFGFGSYSFPGGADL